MRVVSFDIFDTTLIRKCGRPENVFFLLSRNLFPLDKGMQCSFYMWRLQAERKNKLVLKKENLTIEDIYHDFDSMNLGVETSYAILQEKKLESEMLVSNFEIRELIKRKRKEGCQICFISDMYLDSAFLKKILIREKCAESEDLVFVSCECNKTKAGGGLYNYVKNQIGVDYSHWDHYGDNGYSDLRCSKKLGINGHWVDTKYNSAEILVENKYLNYLFGQSLSVLVGLQRCARLHLSGNLPEYSAAADYISSLYIPYLLYLFENAKKQNITRLYFLSRDSYILYELSKLLKNDYPEVQCRYLFLSRKSLTLPLLDDISKENLCFILGDRQSLVGLRITDVVNLLKLEHLTIAFPFTKIKTEQQEDEFISILKAHQQEILLLQQKERRLLDAYLEQEECYDDNVNMAMVDVGWVGTTRLMINKLREYRQLSKIPFFYLGCRNDVISACYGKLYSYLPSQFITPELTFLIESYYSLSDYASTIAYVESGSEIIPVFNDKQEILHNLVQINVDACSEVLKNMKNIFNLETQSAIEVWGISFISLFKENPSVIDYAPLKRIQAPDGDKLIERITPLGLIHYFLTGYSGKLCLHTNSVYNTYGITWTSEKNLKAMFLKIFRKLKIYFV